jgi:DNA-binding transcriptional MerR regulator
MRKASKNPSVPIHTAAELSGLNVHMVVYLGRMDILRPSIGGGRRGSRRMYTFGDVLFLKVIADLLARGIEVSRLRSALKRARFETDTWIDIRRAPAHYLVTDGTELFVRKKGELESKSMNGQLAFAFVLDLSPTHRVISKSWPTQDAVKIKAKSRRH